MHPYLGDAFKVGVRVSEGSGKVAAASLDDLAAADVAVLAQNGHSLIGQKPMTYKEFFKMKSQCSKVED